MTAKMDFRPFYVPANFRSEWTNDFIPHTMAPLIPENSFLAGLRVDRQGQASAFRTYQYLTQKSVIEQKTHDIQQKLQQGSADVERFKLIDPERVWEVRESIIGDLAQDCGDFNKARQLADRYMPLSDEYFKLGYKLHVIEFDKAAVKPKAGVEKAAPAPSAPPLITPELSKKNISVGVLNKKEWERSVQDPNSRQVQISHSHGTGLKVSDIVDGIEVCTITPRDRQLDVLKEKAAKGDINAKSQLLSEKAVKMPEKLPEHPMHVITPKPNPGVLKQPITEKSLKAAAVKAKAVAGQGFKAQIGGEQLTINASDVVGGAIGSTAVRYVQGQLAANEAAKEVLVESGKGVVVNMLANAAGDASRSALENFIPADKIPGIGSTMRVMTVGKAILTAPNLTDAAKKGTDAAANCAIQYGASILVPAVAPTLGTSVGTIAAGATTIVVGLVAAPAVATGVGAAVGTVVAIGTMSFVVGGIGTAGIATKNYVVSKVWKSK